MTLNLKHEKDGKHAGEVVVGISDLRFGQTNNSTTQTQPEPATGNLLNLDEESTGPTIALIPDSRSTGSGSSPTPTPVNSTNPPTSNSCTTPAASTPAAVSSNTGSRPPPQQQATNSPNRNSVLGTVGAVTTAGAAATAGAVGSRNASTLPSTGIGFVVILCDPLDFLFC